MPFDPGYFCERQRKRHAEELDVRIGARRCMAWMDLSGKRAAWLGAISARKGSDVDWGRWGMVDGGHGMESWMVIGCWMLV